MHKLDDGIFVAFPTTILHKKIGNENLNEDLMRVVDELADNTPNTANPAGNWVGGNSSYGSVQSELNRFLGHNSPAVAELKQRIETSIEEYLGFEMKSIEDDQKRASQKFDVEISDVKYEWYGWTVRMGKEDWQGLHIHPQTSYSGVYYMHVPDLPYPEGAIQFVNPHPISTAYGSGQPAGDFVQTKSGDLIIFPSWLAHLVMPFRENNDKRYCLAFNIVVEKFWSQKNEN